MASATATPWLTTPPSGSSSRLAIAGSPRKPMPSEAIVMPSWQAARYSSMRSIWWSASLAPRLPSSSICSTRPSRARTSANSAATKKPLAATSTATPKRRSSSVISGRILLLRGCYFEDRRRRSSADVAESSIGSRQAGDATGQLEVVLSQAALGVRGDRDRDLVPRDREVGVMVHVLGIRSQPVDEVHGPLEVVELELPADRVAVPFPAVQPGQPVVDLLVAQTCHPRLRCESLPLCPRRPRCCSPSVSATAWRPSHTSVTTHPARNNSRT